jgi:hypothetical protein
VERIEYDEAPIKGHSSMLIALKYVLAYLLRTDKLSFQISHLIFDIFLLWVNISKVNISKRFNKARDSLPGCQETLLVFVKPLIVHINLHHRQSVKDESHALIMTTGGKRVDEHCTSLTKEVKFLES